MIEHQCLKCQEKRVMQKVVLVLLKNGRPAIKGHCSTCNSKMVRMLPSFPQAEDIIPAED
jgi:hypothetical protein